MKIPLHMHEEGDRTSKAAQARALERDVLSAKKGDWNAKNSLIRTFTPLIRSLAEKRASQPAQVAKYVEAGKSGILVAIKKYTSSVGPEKFHVFALDFIEKSMDRAEKPAGLLARLFGR